MIKYIFLGIIQGLTEFLPVSSSGHLVISQKLFSINEGVLGLVVLLHLGTVLSLLVFFFQDILKLLRDLKILLKVFLVTLITGAIGLAGKNFFEGLFAQPRLVAVAFLVTAAILVLTRRAMQGKRQDISFADALLLGITQAIAIIPGVSRSGITVSTLLFRGIEKETAFRFSFLAAIPAVAGAAMLEAGEMKSLMELGAQNLIAGFLASFFSGIFSLWILRRIVKQARLHYFGYYCILVAILALIFIKG